MWCISDGMWNTPRRAGYPYKRMVTHLYNIKSVTVHAQKSNSFETTFVADNAHGYPVSFCLAKL